jgi:hypothetical protein
MGKQVGCKEVLERSGTAGYLAPLVRLPAREAAPTLLARSCYIVVERRWYRVLALDKEHMLYWLRCMRVRSSCLQGLLLVVHGGAPVVVGRDE